jgi:two-component system sensor histidine kinase KdpD
MQTPPPTTDVGDLLEALADDLAPLADDHPLEIDIDEGLPLVVADRASVQHVLMNLVVNATKFSPAEAPIDIDVSRETDAVRISVTDRGKGIPADERDRIFEKFVRLQDGGVGVGLGLFICRALVESMGGHIWADDGPDGGARMSFTLQLSAD